MGSYTDRELQVVALRVSGIRPEEIALRLGITPKAVYNRLSRLYLKAGLSGEAELKEWATERGLDELLPETPEEMAVPEKKVRRTKTRIKMGRLRRARLSAGD